MQVAVQEGKSSAKKGASHMAKVLNKSEGIQRVSGQRRCALVYKATCFGCSRVMYFSPKGVVAKKRKTSVQLNWIYTHTYHLQAYQLLHLVPRLVS